MAYVEDIDKMVDSLEEVENMMNIFCEEAEITGLEVNKVKQ